MLTIREENIRSWCRGTSLAYLVVTLLLLFGVVGFGDERFAAILSVRAEQFPIEASPLLAILELALMIGAIFTIWVGSRYYLLIFVADIVFFSFNNNLVGPFLALGYGDAFLSFLNFAIQGFAAGLVLARTSLHIQPPKSA